MASLDGDKGCPATSNSEDSSCHLNRNRSFKSKQLVRSQAIRESTSPPRTASPASSPDSLSNPVMVTNNGQRNDTYVKNTTATATSTSNNGDPRDCLENNNTVGNKSDTVTVRTLEAVTGDGSSHFSDRCSDVISFSDNRISDYGSDDCRKKLPVEIQITSGGWDLDVSSDQRQRTKRWLGHRHHSDPSRDLLSNNPRVACVCGACPHCPHCRGKRRKHACPTKQDSGIVCSEDCPDCSDSEQNGAPNNDVSRKTPVDISEPSFYCRCPERREKPKNMLSRTDSDEKTEPTGVDLVNFIKETLNKNARDRMTLLRIEKELHSLISDTGRCIVRFPVMTSYGRMLVHRCAALFQLSHHIDQSNKNCVLVSKTGTAGGRVPCTNFRQWCTTVFPPSPQRHRVDDTHAKSILKRDAQCSEEEGSKSCVARSKSLEQREKEYERVRRRIFSSEDYANEQQFPWLAAGPVRLLTPDAGGRNKLIKVHSLETGSVGVQSAAGWRGRGAVAKSHSFGGYCGGEQPQHRLLSRQGDLASSSWRLSPSSSGYKTLSLRSTDSVTPSPTGGCSPEPGVPPATMPGVAGGVLWAVTDLSAVPRGAVVLHPQTGRPLLNPDGSVYHFDPTRPLPFYQPTRLHESEEGCDKRRGRLEKQHSFIDNEAEYLEGIECSAGANWCCECRRHDACVQDVSAEKVPPQTENKTVTQPSSPSKTQYEPNLDTTSDQKTSTDISTSQIATCDIAANQNQSSQKSYDVLSNQQPLYDNFTDSRPTYEVASNVRPEPEAVTNQRSYEKQNQQPGHNSQKSPYDMTQKIGYDGPPNQRLGANKLTNQDSLDIPQYDVQQNYMQGFTTEEMTPQQGIQAMGLVQPDTSLTAAAVVPSAKLTPVPMPDPNIRPVSLTGVVYPTVSQGYPYINQCRADQSMQPIQPTVYQHLMPAEEQKHTDNTFRIDPSYGYISTDMNLSAACGTCASCPDPAAASAAAALMKHRGYNMYGQMDMAPPLLAPYPISNVLLPQPHLQPYPQYQEPLQWTMPPIQPMPSIQPIQSPPKLYLQELYPMYPNVYPQYNIYPQVIPQPYPVQPLYPVIDKLDTRRNSMNHRQSKRNSISSSARNTPLQTSPDDKKVPYEETEIASNVPASLSRQNSNEIALKIQQIKDQMAQLSAKERDRDRNNKVRDRGVEDWKRRNSGNGILGSYPTYNGRVPGRASTDDSQLNMAARSMINSMRGAPPKQYHENRRNSDQAVQQQQRGAERGERADYSRGRPRTAEREEGGRRGQQPAQLQYRPPYLFRQVTPGTWCRRSPGAVHPVLNNPRRPHPEPRGARR